MPGHFIISLDFELHWGGSEKWHLEPLKPYFMRTREMIPKILELFAKYEVHVTWATVGMLFHESREELQKYRPDRPSYSLPIAAYDFIEKEGIGADEEEDPFHYAPSLIRRILDTPHQELATHTYSHYYCNEEGQTPEEFRQDLKAAQKIAHDKFDVQMKSLVFPRNQFNMDYLKVCADEGISSVRSNPKDWFWNIDSTQQESRYKRLVRGADAFLPIGKRSSFSEVPADDPLQIPASRLLRPWTPKEAGLGRFKLGRIHKEMERAAMSGENYHLWWHPHNFGNHPERNFQDLEQILQHYKQLNAKFGFESISMAGYTEKCMHEAS